MTILEIQGLTKTFGKKKVLDQLNLTVPMGSLFGFIGENGVGKTTTMKVILGLEEADAGTVKIKGQSVRFGNTPTNRYIGYLPDVPAFYPYLTASEYLILCGELTGIKKKVLREKVAEKLSLVGLENQKGKIKGFSRGMKQRLGIAQALLNDPELLICDEPTSALDPSGRNEFLTLLASLKGQVTMLFSTHILSDVERVCDYVGILDEGRLKACASFPELKEQYAQNKMELTFAQPVDQTMKHTLLTLPELTGIQQENPQTLTLTYHDTYDAAVEQVFELLTKQKSMPVSLKKIDPNLETIFLEVVK
ncbi:ABC transporter ATP-binding protein [Enterococcus florum]|uniref:ABC transporter ATP-binding protein n=1 Tax=Enterococcus florum TaxID=2480627 RepID=A0A4V0WP33_9ENTE|nr:ABC transporter ATP-binding protein [Enterococcus florum]GCF92459.1 ABC transporter ATP-binding protein [Enterococcus florum]